jgi:hypothetical protein
MRGAAIGEKHSTSVAISIIGSLADLRMLLEAELQKTIFVIQRACKRPTNP